MSLPGRWVLRIDHSVEKSLQKIPRRDAEAILEIIKVLPLNPYFGDLQKMHGQDNAWRRRVGSYRLFFKLYSAESTIFVFRLERRASKTY